jgi:hypothetical protein
MTSITSILSGWSIFSVSGGTRIGGLSGLRRSETKTVVEDLNVLALRSNFSSTYYALTPERGG